MLQTSFVWLLCGWFLYPPTWSSNNAHFCKKLKQKMSALLLLICCDVLPRCFPQDKTNKYYQNIYRMGQCRFANPFWQIWPQSNNVSLIRCWGYIYIYNPNTWLKTHCCFGVKFVRKDSQNGIVPSDKYFDNICLFYPGENIGAKHHNKWATTTLTFSV
jgi:hypothetical protein